MEPINPSNALPSHAEPWEPTTIAHFNGNEVMVAKARGAYAWHKHDDTDDFFFVLKGKLTIEMRDRSVCLSPGEMYVVPKGIEHRPVADEEAHFLLIEPPDTGKVGTTLV